MPNLPNQREVSVLNQALHHYDVIKYDLHPAPTPPVPSIETVVALCGGEEMRAELWEDLGKALGMSSEQLEKISVEEDRNLEKCKQCVINVRNSRGTPHNDNWLSHVTRVVGMADRE